MSKPISAIKRLKATESREKLGIVTRFEVNKDFGPTTWIWEADFQLEDPTLKPNRNWVRAEVFEAWIEAGIPWDADKGDFEVSVVTAPGMFRLVYVGYKKVNSEDGE